MNTHATASVICTKPSLSALPKGYSLKYKSFLDCAGGASPGMSLMSLLFGFTIFTMIIAITPQTIRNRNAIMHLSVATCDKKELRLKGNGDNS
jgi:hypothetical protein